MGGWDRWAVVDLYQGVGGGIGGGFILQFLFLVLLVLLFSHVLCLLFLSD